MPCKLFRDEYHDAITFSTLKYLRKAYEVNILLQDITVLKPV